ncbi:MAG: hypothetical protein RLZ98_116 [Pseudomonadota bacterium]|jgi:hypothetical protein
MAVIRKAAFAGAVALAILASASAASAQCVNKAGQGTNTTEDGAKFQAWEAVLQATDWGMWGNWMASSQKVGVAPGYKVSKLRHKCKKGAGLGFECIVQARLCK